MAKYSSSDELIYEPDVSSASRGLSYAVLALICLIAGIGTGLFYTWEISPVVEKNTRPDQLRDDDRLHYIVAIALDYAYTQDLDRTYQLLNEVDPAVDPFQLAADTVCDLKNSGRVQTSADIEAARRLISIYQIQPGIIPQCDLGVFSTSIPPTLVTIAPTPSQPPSPMPAATKTSTPALSVDTTPAAPEITPRATTPSNDFEYFTSSSSCNPASSGLIEIYVRESGTGAGVAGVQVSVQWNASGGTLRNQFYTGLKPNRGTGYADFQMEAGLIYQVILLGRSDAAPRLEADICDSQGTLRSYQVIFQSR